MPYLKTLKGILPFNIYKLPWFLCEDGAAFSHWFLHNVEFTQVLPDWLLFKVSILVYYLIHICRSASNYWNKANKNKITCTDIFQKYCLYWYDDFWGSTIKMKTLRILVCILDTLFLSIIALKSDTWWQYGKQFFSKIKCKNILKFLLYFLIFNNLWREIAITNSGAGRCNYYKLWRKIKDPLKTLE